MMRLLRSHPVLFTLLSILLCSCLTNTASARTVQVQPRVPTPFNTPNLNAPHALPAHHRSVIYEDFHPRFLDHRESEEEQVDARAVVHDGEAKQLKVERDVQTNAALELRERRDEAVQEQETLSRRLGSASIATLSRHEKRERSMRRAAAAWREADASKAASVA